MPRKPFYLEIFTTSLAALLLEIAYTRIFSFKVFYYFTYLIIGVGLLGIGSGGVAVAVSRRLRNADPARLVSWLCFAGGASVLFGYMVIAPTQLNVQKLSSETIELAKLLLVTLLLAVPFLTVGVIISTILSSRPDAANRLYGTDLLGAALGCTLCIPLLNILDPPRTVLLAGLILAIGGFRFAKGSSTLFTVGMLVSAALLLPILVPKLLTDPVVDQSKSLEDFRKAKVIRFSKWNPVFRVDVSDHPFYPGELYLLFHDGQPGSGLRRFDGDFRKFESLRQDPRSLPFEVLPKGPRVLIIGAAGGHEVLASLFFGASHVTGIELNPVTYSLLTKTYADIAGRLHENPRVKLINGDGRWFLKQSKERYDLIWFVAPDSYAAMNAASSGAFVLSESYLYTVEMLRESRAHLTERGIICTQFGELDYDRRPNRTARYLATARKSFDPAGRSDFPAHAMVASADGFPPFLESAVLLSNTPFEPVQVQKFVAQTAKVKGGIVRYVPGQAGDVTVVNRVITLSDPTLESLLARHPYLIDPVHDDSPFFWHFTRFKAAFSGTQRIGNGIMDPEDAVGEQLTLIFLAIVVMLAAFFLLLPLFSLRAVWSLMPHKAYAATYFASLGLGFMFLEVTLIQQLTLLLGFPTYSLSVTLFAILVFSGIGSLLSGRYATGRERSLLLLLGALALIVLAYRAGLPAIIERFVGQPLPFRIALTIALLAPLGLCLGAFMPIGLKAVAELSPYAREYVAWAWAINGFFSVIASVLSTMLAMSIGFQQLLLVALVVYAAGVFALRRLPRAANPEPATRTNDSRAEEHAS